MPEYASRVADSNAQWIPHPNFKHDQKQIPMSKVVTDAAMTREMIGILLENMAKSYASGQTNNATWNSQVIQGHHLLRDQVASARHGAQVYPIRPQFRTRGAKSR